jgi:hypothetical protein
VSPVKYGLGLYIPEDDILHSHRREHLKSYTLQKVLKSTELREFVLRHWMYCDVITEHKYKLKTELKGVVRLRG